MERFSDAMKKSPVVKKHLSLIKSPKIVVADGDPLEQAVIVQNLIKPQEKEICPKCKGDGYHRADVRYGDPLFGKSIPCQCKILERKQRLQHELFGFGGLDDWETFQDATFENYDYHHPGTRVAFRVVRDFAREPYGFLWLEGPCGTGKTHLAVAFAKERIEAGDLVLIKVTPDLLDHLKVAFHPQNPNTYDEVYQQICDTDIVVFDDFGTQQNSDWAITAFFQLVNYRYNTGKITMFISNKKGLEGIDPRIASRMRDNRMVKRVVIDADDYRPLLKKRGEQ